MGLGHGGLFLATPLQTLGALAQLAPTAAFWQRIVFSALRILAGFLLAAAGGLLLGAAGARWHWVRVLIDPAMQLIRAMPVASFVILALLWVRSANLSVIVSFTHVLPVVYAGVLGGIADTDPKLLEMAKVYRLPLTARLRYIWLPGIFPSFCESCIAAMGMCWKSGVSAEVIGLPDHSVGDALYRAKITLSTPDVFAWTLVRGSGGPAAHGQDTSLRGGARVSIVITDLCKRFGSTPVLQRFTWTVDRPMVLMGRSGCGKTTLLRVLLGLESADSGTVTGVETPAAVFQEDRLCPQLTAAANLTLTGHGLTPQDAERELRTLGFTDAELALPAARLSGGQKRRAALLRALLCRDAKTLLLDEPFTGMDAELVEDAVAATKRLAGERPTILVTHDRTAADLLGWPVREV